jgi:hypothetical protein
MEFSAKLVYELTVAVPELDAVPGDIVILEAGRPAMTARRHDADTAVGVLERYPSGITLCLCEGATAPRSTRDLRAWLRDPRPGRHLHLLSTEAAS